MTFIRSSILRPFLPLIAHITAYKNHTPVIAVNIINIACHVFAGIPQVHSNLAVIVVNRQDANIPNGVVHE